MRTLVLLAMVGHVGSAAGAAAGHHARQLSLPHAIASAGGLDQWNGATAESAALARMIDGMVRATTVDEALAEVGAILSLGHPIWAYAYMRALHARDERLYFEALLADPERLLPVVYTPTVGEACQKFGALPARARGCFVSLAERGRVKDVLREYALAAGVPRGADGHFLIEAIVLTDGGRILGLGDLGAWGMGIPLGKLDLYTVCAGFDPQRTLPILLDVGISPPAGNTARLAIDADARYTGLRQPRALEQSAAGTAINSAHHGREGLVEELMQAATELFGPAVLLQFEDFNANDAFPLLAASRARYLTFNDDIQGTAAVIVAGLLGALRLRQPEACDLRAFLRTQRFLFHGSGSANLGAAALLRSEGGVPAERIWLTNSRGLLWRLADGQGAAAGGDEGNFRNGEQRALAAVLPAPPSFAAGSLRALVRELRPHFLVGAVGTAPGCFDRTVVDAMVEVRGSRGWRAARTRGHARACPRWPAPRPLCGTLSCACAALRCARKPTALDARMPAHPPARVSHTGLALLCRRAHPSVPRLARRPTAPSAPQSSRSRTR
jgi:malic enzyme